jgi:two-component system, NtrC family, sensor histidine kinase PilS
MFSVLAGDSQLHDPHGADSSHAAGARTSTHSTIGASSLSSSASGSRHAAPEARGASDAAPTWAEGDSTAKRLYRLFVGARAVLGAAVVAGLVAGGMLGMRAPLGVMLLAMAYATQAVVVWILPRFRQDTATGSDGFTRRQWLVTIGVDLVTFGLLHAFQPTQNFNFIALLLLPVLMGGLLAPRMVALAGTATATLFVLAVTWTTLEAGGDRATLWLQAGLAGAGFFAATLLSGEMANRVASQALAARSGLALARQQAQLNRLVIEEMADGVLVVDARSRVRAANPAARRLMVREGLSRAPPFELHDEGAWRELDHAVQQAFIKKSWAGNPNAVTLKFDGGLTRTLRVRARFTRASVSQDGPTAPTGQTYCVLFLEDQRIALDRNRQEKLAAMGRVSAGIAHEIRNPLAAIAQANALMREEVVSAEHQMLTRMIGENVERLKMIVDDVMAVAPSRDDARDRIDATAVVRHIVDDWLRASGDPQDTQRRLQVRMPAMALSVVFDGEHLRRVLVNLLDNARRHASAQEGAIVLSLSPTPGDLVALSVASDGATIGADVEPYLFEPFFSTRSRGTGLGLYICRELCERYGATIDYWKHPSEQRHVNEFRVVFRTTPSADFSDSRLSS